MPITISLEGAKKWIPWAASAVIIIFSLLIFWGIISVTMKFLGADSYFDVPAPDNSLSSDSVKKRNNEMSELLKTRDGARQQVGGTWNLGEGERDPFKLQ